MNSRFLLLPLACAGLALPAAAHVVTGHVVDSQGVPVANVDIDAKNLGSGGDPTLSGDHTDAFGNFAVDVPAGAYDFLFFPPKPPATTHLPKKIEGVVVTAPLSLGTIVLAPGAALSGKTVSSTGLPIAGINLDVIDPAGVNILLQGDFTDALGQFSLAVPLGSIEVQFKTAGVPWPSLLAPVGLELVMTGNLNLGNVVIPPGFHVTGTVLKPGGPAANIDLDFVDVTTDQEIFTQNDNTTASGTYDVVVPAGTYDVEFCPPAGVLLTAAVIKGVVVTTSKSLGTTLLSAGVMLSGTVTSTGGTPLGSIDIDLIDPVSGSGIQLCHDKTNPSGFYGVVVPTGTFHVAFDPPYSMPYAKTTFLNQVITGPKVLSGSVPDCPFFVNYGSGTAGAGGIKPHLQTSGGTPRPGNPSFAYELSAGVGGAPAFLAASSGTLTFPIFGGTGLIDPSHIIATVPLVLSGPAGVPGAGKATFPMPVEIVPAMVGVTLYHQYVAVDFAAPASFSMSEGMAYTFCP
jgi:hypothetical protein